MAQRESYKAKRKMGFLLNREEMFHISIKTIIQILVLEDEVL